MGLGARFYLVFLTMPPFSLIRQVAFFREWLAPEAQKHDKIKLLAPLRPKSTIKYELLAPLRPKSTIKHELLGPLRPKSTIKYVLLPPGASR